MALRVDIDRAREDLRLMFAQWGIDRSEYEIVWQEELLVDERFKRLQTAYECVMESRGEKP